MGIGTQHSLRLFVLICYNQLMEKRLLNGTVHKVPTDLRTNLLGSPGITEIWNDLTPLARNEWICWVISVQKAETRVKHIDRVSSDLSRGKRRPCCWPGCPHRQKS